jgi:purine-binding chemotaxis protein CheW
MEEATQKASPEKNPTDDANGARTTFQPAPPEANPSGRKEHLSTIADREGKYLTFTLAGEEYGIGILKIKEIIGMMPITSVPQTPPFVKGVINLRGKVIPVVDLRLRFTMDAIDYNDRTCIIVVEIGGGTDIVIGIVVDSVSEVLNIKSEDIEDTPTFGTTLNTDYILGMAKMEGKVKILLDIDTVLSQEDIHMLQRAA